MNRLFIFCLMLIAVASKAQSTARSIVYEVLENGKVLPNRSIRLKCSAEVALISNPNAVEQLSIDYIGRKTIKSNTLMNQKYTVFTKFEELPKPQVTALKDTILGYPCQKVTYDLFSNRLEVWYTTAAMVKGSPSISFVPENGLVLKYVVNENRTIRAVSTALIDEQLVLPTDLGEVVSEAKYAALQIKSRYTVIPVFSNQQINYELSIQNPAPNRLDTTYRYSKGNIILKKIKLPKNSKKGSLFVSLTERSNGDAYDRVGSVFTFRPSDSLTILDAFEKGILVLPTVVDNGGQRYQGIVPSGQYQPVVELMRFFTPFGVGHFNNKRVIEGYQWAETASYKQEITALVIESLNLEDVSPTDIDPDAALFVDGLGLDSIDALELGLALQKRYGVAMSGDAQETRRHFSSVRALASFVDAARTK